MSGLLLFQDDDNKSNQKSSGFNGEESVKKGIIPCTVKQLKVNQCAIGYKWSIMVEIKSIQNVNGYVILKVNDGTHDDNLEFHCENNDQIGVGYWVRLIGKINTPSLLWCNALSITKIDKFWQRQYHSFEVIHHNNINE